VCRCGLLFLGVSDVTQSENTVAVANEQDPMFFGEKRDRIVENHESGRSALLDSRSLGLGFHTVCRRSWSLNTTPTALQTSSSSTIYEVPAMSVNNARVDRTEPLVRVTSRRDAYTYLRPIHAKIKKDGISPATLTIEKSPKPQSSAVSDPHLRHSIQRTPNGRALYCEYYFRRHSVRTFGR